MSLSLDLLAYGDTDDVPQSAQFVVQGGPTVSVQLDGTDPQVTPAGLGQVLRTRTGTTAQGEPFTVFHVSLTVPHWTPTLAVTLNPIKFAGILGTSLAVDILELSLETIPAQSLHRNAAPNHSADQPASGAGRLESAGAQDDYVLDVTSPGTNVVATDSRSTTRRAQRSRTGQAGGLGVRRLRRASPSWFGVSVPREQAGYPASSVRSLLLPFDVSGQGVVGGGGNGRGRRGVLVGKQSLNLRVVANQPMCLGNLSKDIPRVLSPRERHRKVDEVTDRLIDQRCRCPRTFRTRILVQGWPAAEGCFHERSNRRSSTGWPTGLLKSRFHRIHALLVLGGRVSRARRHRPFPHR